MEIKILKTCQKNLRAHLKKKNTKFQYFTKIITLIKIYKLKLSIIKKAK